MIGKQGDFILNKTPEWFARMRGIFGLKSSQHTNSIILLTETFVEAAHIHFHCVKNDRKCAFIISNLQWMITSPTIYD